MLEQVEADKSKCRLNMLVMNKPYVAFGWPSWLVFILYLRTKGEKMKNRQIQPASKSFLMVLLSCSIPPLVPKIFLFSLSSIQQIIH